MDVILKMFIGLVVLSIFTLVAMTEIGFILFTIVVGLFTALVIGEVVSSMFD